MCVDWFAEQLLNKQTTVRRQLLTAFGVVALCSVALTLGISLGLIIKLGNKISPLVQSSLESQAQRHAVSAAREIASTVEQRLLLIGNSITMTSARQAAWFVLPVRVKN